jgi:4-amino-4-deoxy-L-arabinose transferase-like glycosyltransferase
MTWRRWLGIYGLLGLAVLAKGPSGLVLPLAVMLTAETLAGWRRTGTIRGVVVSLANSAWEAIRGLRVVSGCGAALLIATPWYVAVGVATDGAWPAGFLGRHNVQRFMGPLEGHGGPIVYYLPAILIGLLPWSLWLPAALAGAWRRMRTATLDRADLALLSWIAVYVGVFSLAGTKLPSYVLPCYPALAVLIGRHVAREHARLPGGPFLGLAVIGIALSAGLVAADRWLVDNVAWLAVIGAIPTVGGLVAWQFHRRQQPQLGLGVFAGSAALLLAGLFGIAAEAVDDRQTPVVFARRLSGAPVATLDAFRPNLVFYSGRTVTDCPTPEEAVDFLARSPDAFLVTREEHWDRLQPLLPPDVSLIARERMFLRKFDLLLIGRTGSSVAVSRDPRAGPRSRSATGARGPAS